MGHDLAVDLRLTDPAGDELGVLRPEVDDKDEVGVCHLWESIGRGHRERQRRAAWRVWQADVATRLHGDWADLGGVVVHATGLPVRHWNGAHLIDPSGVEHLDEVDAWFAERRLPWGLLVPAELWLTPPGMRHVTDQKVQVRRLHGLPPSRSWTCGGTTARASRSCRPRRFDDDVSTERAFVLPKLVNEALRRRHGVRRGRPVSTATLVVVDEVAAVFGVATLSSYRRRGLGRAVTLAVLHEGVRRGADVAYLNPSDLGDPVYRALGFVDELPWRVWVPREGAEA